MTEGRAGHDASPREGFWTKVGGGAGALGVVVAIFFGVTQCGGSSDSGLPTPTKSAPPPESAPADPTPEGSSSDSPFPDAVSTIPSKPQTSATLISTSTFETENKRFVDLDSDDNDQVVGDTSNAPSGADLRFGNVGRVQPMRPARMYQITRKSADLCLTSISEDRDGIREVMGDDLREGDSICVVTTDQNIVILQVTRAPIGKYFEGGIEFTKELYQTS
jgi:hypothetical protein